ncbi:hypothetical protein ACRDNQ_03845 [Palleronia sp. KMU-117]|uniref:hypothetical protein n=1 Tax=Palleronia sp. KMU-117 TaxID=3434108 RepID=UPI003D7322A1
MRRFVGFYWTLPVPFAKFTALPDDIDAAAEKSTTIRYQRERVRRWVKEEKGELSAERAFLELAPDRGTPEGATAVDAAITVAKAQDAELVLVDFGEAFGWRTHPALRHRLESSGHPFVMLPPEPVFLDGKRFDPIAHFRTWAETWREYRGSKETRKGAVLAALGTLAVEEMTYAEVAASLNEAGVPTVSGKSWTKETLRKFLAMP